MVNEYIRSFDHSKDAWTKRSDAADFAAFLAGELGINPKGVIVDKDGKTYRVYVPLISAYWSPAMGGWEHGLRVWKTQVKQWAST